MAYADYSTAYLNWLQGQLNYINGSAYANFQLAKIDPSFEVQSFKNSTDISQQIIFHNAADDQVATLRSLKEIAKQPSDYFDEYATFLAFEQVLMQTTATKVDTTHSNQQNAPSDALNFYSTFAPDLMVSLGLYDPMAIFTMTGTFS